MSVQKTYLFVKTHGRLLNEVAELRKLSKAIERATGHYTEFLRFGPENKIWSKGFAVRLYSDGSLLEIENALKECLGWFPAWTLYRSPDEFIERPEQGSISESAWALRGKPISIMFLLAKPDNYAFGEHVDAVTKRLTGAVPCPIFSLSDGVILAVSVDEEPRITRRRGERQLANFEDYVFDAPNGDTYWSELGGHPWKASSDLVYIIYDSQEVVEAAG